MARRLGISATAVVPANAPQAKLEKLRLLGRANRSSRQRCLVACNKGRRTRRSNGRLHRRGARPRFAGRRCNDRRRNSRAVARCRGHPRPIRRRRPVLRHRMRIARAQSAHEDHRLRTCERAPIEVGLCGGCSAPTLHEPGFVSGMGFASVLPEMWPLAKSVIDHIITVSLAQVAQAIKLLAENNRIIAEGAGAVAVAAALSGQYRPDKVCAVISGGNIDSDVCRVADRCLRSLKTNLRLFHRCGGSGAACTPCLHDEIAARQTAPAMECRRSMRSARFPVQSHGDQYRARAAADPAICTRKSRRANRQVGQIMPAPEAQVAQEE